jgi:carbon storage regulator
MVDSLPPSDRDPTDFWAPLPGKRTDPSGDAGSSGSWGAGPILDSSKSVEMGLMLVLTRKTNQSIMIGNDIEVSVSIVGEKVRIGIQAPREIPVYRKEVYLEIQQRKVAERASARGEVDDALKRLSSQPEEVAKDQ